MNKVIVLVFLLLPFMCTGQKYPIGKPGLTLTYSSETKDLPGSAVREFELTVGAVELKTIHGNASNKIKARATVTEGSAPVYYTQGADKNGIYKNSYVLWELYDPEEEDYTATVEFEFKIDLPGFYRLRISTADVAEWDN